MHHPIDRIAHTTAFVTPVVEQCLDSRVWRKISKNVLNELKFFYKKPYLYVFCAHYVYFPPRTRELNSPQRYVLSAPVWVVWLEREIYGGSLALSATTAERQVTNWKILNCSGLPAGFRFESLWRSVTKSGELGLTCTFTASCCSTRLSWAHTPVINWALCLRQKISS